MSPPQEPHPLSQPWLSQARYQPQQPQVGLLRLPGRWRICPLRIVSWSPHSSGAPSVVLAVAEAALAGRLVAVLAAGQGRSWWRVGRTEGQINLLS